ncbi:MAG: transporter [Cyclobacteriaceae bacterium]|jgi:hypothetical protein|nr:transporter [Cyclobacteriaceae bacterium]
MKSLIALLCAFIGGINYCHAQFNETIRTGRPGQAIGAFTVGHTIFQVQSGFDYYKSTTSASIFSEGFLNNTVMRFGLTEPFEVSALVEYKTETITDNDVKTEASGLSALDLGMRYHIYTGKGLVPNVGFQIRTRLPVLSEDYKIKDLAPRFILVTSQKLSDKFTLITNWGAAWNGNDSAPRGTYVVNLSFPFNDSFGAFIETFGGLQKGTSTINFDTGLAWLINPDLQLDLYSGYGNNQGINDFFLSMGVSWRTSRAESSK